MSQEGSLRWGRAQGGPVSSGVGLYICPARGQCTAAFGAPWLLRFSVLPCPQVFPQLLPLSALGVFGCATFPRS